MRQSNKASGTSQGPEQNRKIVRPQCLDGVATMNIVKWQLQTTLWPDNMLTLLRQNYRVKALPEAIFLFLFFCADSATNRILLTIVILKTHVEPELPILARGQSRKKQADTAPAPAQSLVPTCYSGN